jgi:hypothetical protein
VTTLALAGRARGVPGHQANGFVTVCGTGMLLDGAHFRFGGANVCELPWLGDTDSTACSRTRRVSGFGFRAEPTFASLQIGAPGGAGTIWPVRHGVANGVWY